jgi:hypothetical protein
VTLDEFEKLSAALRRRGFALTALDIDVFSARFDAIAVSDTRKGIAHD